MDTKICNRCGKEKPITEFCYRKKENVYRNPCKDCKKEYLKEYAKKNKSRLTEYRKEYYDLNKDHKLEYQSNYRKNNEDTITEKRKKYNSSNYEKTKEYKKNYYLDNKEEIAKKFREYYESTKESRKEYRSNYYKNNKDKVNLYVRERKKSDKLFKLKHQVRNMLWESFNRRNKQKNRRSAELLGCDIDYFLAHLLKTYENIYGVEWDGKEKVHIDHIKPLATAKTEEEVIKLCHYTNLQLLKGEDNLSKGDKLNWKKE